MKLSKELISEIYYNVDANLKAKIENEVPEMKPKLEPNRWLKCDKYPKWMIFVNDDLSAYGFNTSGNYFINTSNEFELYLTNHENRYATPEEVKTALINEAKRIGYEGNKIYCIRGLIGSESIRLIDGYFSFEENTLNYSMKGGKFTVFFNGKWAKIITEPTEKELLIEKLNELKEKANELENQINQMR